MLNVLPGSASARRRVLRSLLGTAVGVAFLVLAWRALRPSLSWRSVDLQPGPILLAFAGAFAFLLARAWRYHLLLPRRQRGAGRMLSLTAATWAIGLLVPGPSADASFVALSRSKLGVSPARATGVSLVGRLLDVVSLGLVALLAEALSDGDEPVVAVVAAGVAGLLGAVLLVGMLLERPRRALLRRAARFPRVASWVERSDRTLGELSDRRRAALLFVSTGACRVATAFEYLALFALVDIHLGFWEMWFALAIRTFLTAIPIQGIAGIGTSQAWWTTALVLAGVAAGPAVAASVTLQVLDLAVALSLSTVITLATWRTWTRARAAQEPGPADLVGKPPYAVRVATR